MELITQVSCEIEEVLAHTQKELVQKIPINIRNFFLENTKNVTDYTAKYNPDVSLNEQELLDETKGILTLFYRDYWCSEEEKKKLENILNENERKYQEELRKEYNPDVFAKSTNIEVIDKETSNMPAVIVELKWYEKVLEKIKKWLAKFK